VVRARSQGDRDVERLAGLDPPEGALPVGQLDPGRGVVDSDGERGSRANGLPHERFEDPGPPPERRRGPADLGETPDDYGELDRAVLGSLFNLGQRTKESFQRLGLHEARPPTSVYRLLGDRIEGELSTYQEDPDSGGLCAHTTFEQGARRGTHPERIGTIRGDYLLRPVEASRTTVELDIRTPSPLAPAGTEVTVLRSVSGADRLDVGYARTVDTELGPVLLVRFSGVRSSGELLPELMTAVSWAHTATGHVEGLEQLEPGQESPVRTSGWKDGAQPLAGRALDAARRNAALLPGESLEAIAAALRATSRRTADAVLAIGRGLDVAGELVATAGRATARLVLDAGGAVVAVLVETAEGVVRHVLAPAARSAAAATYELVRDAGGAALRLVVRVGALSFEGALRPVGRAIREAVREGYRAWRAEWYHPDGTLRREPPPDGPLGVDER